MKSKSLMLVVVAAAWVAGALAQDSTSRPASPRVPLVSPARRVPTEPGAPVVLLPQTGLVPDKPDTWAPAVARAQGSLDAMAEALMGIALDKTRSDKDRRAAIVLVGKIGTPKCYDFLVDNASMRMMPGDILADTGFEDFPCPYVLGSSGDWRAAQAILLSMDQPKTKEEVIHLSGPLRAIMGNKVIARAVVEAKLQFNQPNIRKANLEQLKEFLSH